MENEPNTNATGCLLCGADDLWTTRLVKDGYAVEDCGTCGLTQLHPCPSESELAALYDADYFSGMGDGYSAYGEQQAEYAATFNEDLDRLARWKPTGRVLDVGCGYGYFLGPALARDYDAYGMDLSDHAAAVARVHHPGRVFTGTPAQALGDATAPFDVIYASHLIEHIPSPVAYLRTLRAHLRDDGVLMLITPNQASLLARFSGKRWVSYKVPEHVAFYTPATMTRLLERAGYAVEAIDPAYQYYRLPFVAKRLRELFDPASRLVPPVERTAPLRDRLIRVTSGSLRVIARPAAGR